MDEPEEEDMDMQLIQQGMEGEGNAEPEAKPKVKGMYEDVDEVSEPDEGASEGK